MSAGRAQGDRLAGAVLAGGAARRLGGIPKGLLRCDGERIVDRTVRLLRELCGETVIVANDPRAYEGVGVPIVADRRPGSGPLAGLDAAFAATRGEFLLVVACDMPAVEPAVLRMLCGAPGADDVVVPVIGGRPEPLCARYSRRCAGPIAEALAAGRLKTTSFYVEVRVREVGEEELRRVDPALRTFSNANTPEEARALGLELPE